MYVESTARLRGHINNSQGKFEVGTGFYPRPDTAPADGGNIIGGASVYIMKSRPAAEQQAAWEFVKYVTSPPVQAQWQADTGYYPIRKAAYNEPVAKEWDGKYPQFNDRDRPDPTPSRSTASPRARCFGVFPQARQRIEKAIEEVLLGKSGTKAALDARRRRDHFGDRQVQSVDEVGVGSRGSGVGEGSPHPDSWLPTPALSSARSRSAAASS